MSTRIAIIGDGAMGTLSAKLLAQKGYSVILWSAFEANAVDLRATRVSRFLPELRLPDAVEITTDPAAVFAGAELAVSAVPAQFARSVWARLTVACPHNMPICSSTKGIEKATLLRPTQVLADVLTGSPGGSWPLAALSGPTIARELACELPATAVAASRDEALARRVQHLFTTPYFRVYTNSDIVGVELAGATKNVIAIAAGILDGLRIGDNAKAALLTRGLVEITRLGVALGGRRETFFGLAGVGDLVTTCVSPYGRNRAFGEAIGRGRTVQEALSATAGEVEGVATTVGVVELARRHRVEMPITQAVHAVIFGGQSPADVVRRLMARPPRPEA